jgi:hypothetical protein
MATIPPTRRVLDFLTRATSGGAEANLEQLFEIFELPRSESTLGKVACVEELLSGMGLRLVPDLRKGEVDSPRRVVSRELRTITPGIAMAEITGGESSNLELKSSLMYNHARALGGSGASVTDLRSDEVIHSALKSVAAFLTSGGGVLYIGVADDCSLLGIGFDFKLLSADRQNEDGWELQLRNLIKGNFKDGDNVNDYVQLRFIHIDGLCIARAEVGPRSKLSFLKHRNTYHLFRRQGNRTEELTIDQIEEFLAVRAAST